MTNIWLRFETWQKHFRDETHRIKTNLEKFLRMTHAENLQKND